MKKASYTVRPATAGDIKHFYGDKMKRTVRAFTWEKDGEPKAIAGVTLGRENIVAFSTMKDDIPAKVIYKGALFFSGFLEKFGVEVLAIASDKYPNSTRFLEFVGFDFYNIQAGKRIYKWRTR